MKKLEFYWIERVIYKKKYRSDYVIADDLDETPKIDHGLDEEYDCFFNKEDALNEFEQIKDSIHYDDERIGYILYRSEFNYEEDELEEPLPTADKELNQFLADKGFDDTEIIEEYNYLQFLKLAEIRHQAELEASVKVIDLYYAEPDIKELITKYDDNTYNYYILKDGMILKSQDKKPNLEDYKTLSEGSWIADNDSYLSKSEYEDEYIPTLYVVDTTQNAKSRYVTKNIKQVKIELNRSTDAREIEFLEGVNNKQGLIKKLLKRYKN